MIKKMLAAVFLASVASLANAKLLYDVQFGSPPNIHGERIAIDSSIRTPSAVVFGSPVMYRNFAQLPGNWAVFNTPTCGVYEQIRFDLAGGTEHVSVSYDIHSRALNSSDNYFAVLLDTDTGVRTIDFHGGTNRISVFNAGSFFLGSFVDQQTYRVRVDANVLTNQLVVSIDGVQRHSGQLGSANVRSIRMNLAPWTSAASACGATEVAVSNIKIESLEVEPEPPVAETVSTEISLVPGTPNVVGPNGGEVRYRGLVTNLVGPRRPIRSWIYATTPDGSVYPLTTVAIATIEPGRSGTFQSTFSVPAWFPAGLYTLRLTAVDPVNGRFVSDSVPFTKQ